MAEFYTNLPPVDKDRFEKTIDKLRTTNYEEQYQFSPGEYDATIAYFVKRGFTRTAAESTAIAILSQAKIDNVKPTEILDIIGTANPVQLDELVTVLLNANRYKSSRLGVRQNRSAKDTVSRNIID